MVKGSREDQNMVQSITRDPGHVPVPATGRFPGLQINASAAFPVSRFPSDILTLLPAYSDEIAQDFHLLLFYPLFCFGLLQKKRHLMLSLFSFTQNTCILALLFV